jgi:hypothetical protein
MDNYFNLSSPGIDPLVGTLLSATPELLFQTDCFLAYVAPSKGTVVRVNVNSAFSASFYSTATFDFIIMKPGVGPGPISWNAGVTQWTVGTYITGRQMSGWSNAFAGTTNFDAGDLIFCYVVDNNGNIWGTGALPLTADNGIFNVTLYLRFSL